LRDKEHLTFVSRQPCLLCGRQPADAHHLRFVQGATLGRKVSDEFTVPLCRMHHRELHRGGEEAKWWTSAGIEPLAAALTLWQETHPLRTTVQRTSAEGLTGAFSVAAAHDGENDKPNS
jgi:hypothetical protein